MKDVVLKMQPCMIPTMWPVKTVKITEAVKTKQDDNSKKQRWPGEPCRKQGQLDNDHQHYNGARMSLSNPHNLLSVEHQVGASSWPGCPWGRCVTRMYSTARRGRVPWRTSRLWARCALLWTGNCFSGSSVRMLGLVAHTCNSSTLKTEEDCKFEAFVGYHGKCQASQPLKKKKKKDF